MSLSLKKGFVLDQQRARAAGEARSNPHTCAIPPVIIKVLTDDKIARVAKFKIHSRYGYAGLSSH
jgi:hypothetical protein